ASNPSGGVVDLLSLIPKCGSCLEDFDTFLHSPQILPCCHTFCLMCISKDKQRKKRRCTLCKEKYSRFLVNTAYLVLIARVHAQRRLEERSSVRCEECDKRLPLMSMRRCATCEHEIQKVAAHLHQTCCVCLECCVDRHNGHELHRIITNANVPKGTCFPQILPSQPRQQIFVRRRMCGSGAPSSPSTGVTSAASSSSGSNPGSHQSTLRTNKEPFKREGTNGSNQTTCSTLKMDNTVGGIKFANLMRRLDGLRKLSEKGSLDFDASLESALSSIENTEYFRRCDIESGFCSPMTNSINAECTIRDNSVGEQMLTMAKAHRVSDDARDNSNCRVAPCYVPNMPRRNRFLVDQIQFCLW
uniref:B box-type domain-containing protein n=4 Tax=Parascaris univalens TaxID=6257 RepID=A0A915CEB9_PARUN